MNTLMIDSRVSFSIVVLALQHGNLQQGFMRDYQPSLLRKRRRSSRINDTVCKIAGAYNLQSSLSSSK